MNGMNDISGKGRGQLPEDKLMAYLEGRLSPEEQHEVEEWLADEGMESDAMEGLKELAPAESRQAADKLKLHLKAQLKGRRPRRKPLSGNSWGLVAVIVILLLCIACYIIFKLSLVH
jgi:anti-sigma factor RsiW